MKPECTVLNLGLTKYETAWGLQQHLAKEIAAGKRAPTLLLLEHPHTYTFGRRGDAQNLVWDESELAKRNIELHWVDRGGDVTYHGPGQLVGYPLLPLAPGGLRAHSGQRLPQADYIGYLRSLESAIIRALTRLGVPAGQVKGQTGVWVQADVFSRCSTCPPELKGKPAKIASIGVKVDVRGISQHGFALNVQTEMSYWEGIIACGLRGYPNVNLADLIQPAPEMAQVVGAIIEAFGIELGYAMRPDPVEAGHLSGNLKRG